ncbi:MAG: transcriptional repressor [Candidatus Marinimicrobia bacterium]|nr:transcriptional repressor [Candidatus Neomarinimicrobiota bacterium]|tara:strand:- start:360 stop:728 length:369 start_codon:yes stop_codon:yes gene_type:complete
MRFSQQRQIIKEIIFSTNSHPTADWVYTKAKTILPNISLGTVYRNLKQLEKNGIIRIVYDGSLARYDWNTKPHNHLKCQICGEMIDAHLNKNNLIKDGKANYDFEVSDVEITLIGKCSKHNK